MIHLLLPLAVIFPAFALHVFITFGLFRKCFTELVGLHELFPDTPIMALTATLLADLKKELITHYLKNPVIVKSTVNRPNIKLCVGDYDFKVEKSTKRKEKKTGLAEDDDRKSNQDKCSERTEIQSTSKEPKGDKTLNKNGNSRGSLAGRLKRQLDFLKSLSGQSWAFFKIANKFVFCQLGFFILLCSL